ncbi:MAG: hypothetical protein DRJ31_04680 [Candidatus Methanomethylicota archaeon]|uniref:Dehydrogenase n=1 Tax=Thermoproteota archaeon TaxID=2056631 RepID=A0A497ER32_9CREN|nr:MAG: hypothetical protein DRJ31_04680 [Candidatus Verstraetearchaeota archaeon]
MELVEIAFARSRLYSLLAKCFKYPSGSPWDYMSRPDEEDFKRVEKLGALLGLPNLAKNFRRLVEMMDLMPSAKEKLEYSRLFAAARFGEGPCPLNEEAYVERKEGVKSVGNAYREFGLEFSEDFKDSPDHIAAELEFMHILAYYEAVSRRANIKEDVHRYVEAQDRFLKNHLAKWVSKFRKLVEENSRSFFYQLAAKMVDEFVSRDSIFISSILGE